jgi:hypothetical protein
LAPAEGLPLGDAASPLGFRLLDAFAFGRGGWTRAAILSIEFERFLDELAKPGKNGLFVVAMASAIKQVWAGANVTLIFFRPLHNFGVTLAIVHRFDSLIALLTSLS